jgi:microsomal dipeptidase-like Zn-dependent dipeptidase
LLRFAKHHLEQYWKEGGYFDTEVKQVTHADMRRVAARLIERGYSEQAVRNILGQNWLRVVEQVRR